MCQITSSSASMSFSDRIVDTEIERRVHANWTGCSSRILLAIGRAEGAVGPWWRELLHCGCEGQVSRQGVPISAESFCTNPPLEQTVKFRQGSQSPRIDGRGVSTGSRSACSRMTLALSLALVPVGSPL